MSLRRDGKSWLGSPLLIPCSLRFFIWERVDHSLQALVGCVHLPTTQAAQGQAHPSSETAYTLASTCPSHPSLPGHHWETH